MNDGEETFEIRGVTGGPFGTNSFMVIDLATGKCAVIDPGYDADESWGEIIKQDELELESILLTHGHIDHVCGVAAMHKAFPDVPIYIHEIDVPQLSGPVNVQVAAGYGLPTFEPVEPTGFLEEGKPVMVGETEFEVLFVPGHCPGHVAFLSGRHLIDGDVLFAGSIGRTDLPGGHMPTLANSIVEKLMVLDDDVVVYPGHGPITTIGQERERNPFVVDMLARAAGD